MQTLVIDIIDNKAVKLLRDLESLDLIHIHKNDQAEYVENTAAKLKGKMVKQSVAAVEKQLDELRSAWS